MVEKMKPVLSVIIPAYNASRTILRAIDSIQANDEVEIIVVENGSTDRTYQIVQERENVSLLQSEKGVSNARNLGIEKANGKWISFLDADDTWSEEALEVLLKDAKTNAYDLYVYGHIAGNDVRCVAQTDSEYCDEACESIKVEMISNPTKYMQAWGKLFRKDILDMYQIRFHPQMRFSEDSDFTLQYLACCKSIYLSSHNVYQYTLNSNSVMRVFDGTKTQAYTEAMEISAGRVKNASKEIQTAFKKYVLMHLNILMVREVFAQNNPASYTEKVRMEKEIAQKDVFHSAMSVLTNKDAKNARLLPAVLLKNRQYRLASLLFLVRAKMNARKEKANV